MPIDTKTVVTQIDTLAARYDEARNRSQYDDLSDLPDAFISEINTLMSAMIDRLSPSGSRYRQNADVIVKEHGTTSGYSAKLLMGILNALKADYVAGYLASVNELIQAEIFADFLDMAQYLLEQEYKDAAAVLAGGVLEEHLRKLCQKHSIETETSGGPKKADVMNSELAKAEAYNKLDQKSVTSWLDLRNKAAHGRYAEYKKEQVALMLQGVRDFITRTITS